MTKKTLLLILSSFFLAGCYAQSMTLIQSGVGASQGRAIQSAVSPAISFTVKQTTGKFPIEHLIKREKQRMAKKATEFEKKIFNNVSKIKKKVVASKEIAPSLKNSINGQVTKLNNPLFKFKTFSKRNFSHKPRFSYKPR